MPQLLDLPAEALHNIFKHLSTQDALKAAVVCKCINRVVTPSIYRVVKLSDGAYCECPECEPLRDDDDPAWIPEYGETHPPVSEALRKLKAFCATLSQVPYLARQVRSLEFKTRYNVFKNNIQWANMCNDEILSCLLEKLPLLQHIHIDKDWFGLLLKHRPALPQLRAAFLWQSPSSDLLYFIKQPRLIKVFLFYNGVSIPPLQHLSTVSEIFLRSQSTNPDQLRALLKIPKSLKSLFWQRTATHQGHALKHLRIEATLAIGIQTCPKWFNDSPVERGVETRAFMDFVALLPTKLETMWLEMDREQCDRHGLYGLGIVDALLTYRKRLASVHTIMLEEINAWYSEGACSCDCHTINACYTHIRQSLSESEKDLIFLEQQKGASVAINIYYLAERLSRKEKNNDPNSLMDYDLTYTRTLLELGREPRTEVWNYTDLVQRNHKQWRRIFEQTLGESILPLESSCPANEIMYGAPVEEPLKTEHAEQSGTANGG
ncbi:hypothetical protein H2200_001970 [Cladophialophora chaetospira]|uniref:F-box domain-containing protein n=1 Tax=Cladophialophora chaetospira TaxID=386627 RepID=A0AA39CNH6_9EURO|nr:hypothetical protein H2200_001970 [Cladophialophora chaetospira]